PERTIKISSTKIVRTKSQPSISWHILAIKLVPPIVLPVRKISPDPAPINTPANIADVSGSPSDSTMFSVLYMKNEMNGTVKIDKKRARFGKYLYPIIIIMDVRMNVTIPGDQPNA